MNQWDVYRWEFPWGIHPVVVVTPTALRRQEYINVLACSSHRAQRLPKATEILLDEADGLDWPTLCKLSPIWAIEPSKLRGHCGTVVMERRRQFGLLMIQLYGLLL